MHAQDFLIDASTDGHGIEDITECLPKLDVVTTLAIIIEAIDASDAGALMVATQSEEVLRVLVLVAEQEAYCLKAALATVHIIAKEEIVRLRWESTILEEAKEVVVLSVYVATDL